MRRGFTMIELLTVSALIFIIATALTHSVFKAKARARLSKARAEMAAIVAEVQTAKDPQAAAEFYSDGAMKDPWGNAYRVTVRRTVLAGEGLTDGTSAVWYPNAYSPRGDGK